MQKAARIKACQDKDIQQLFVKYFAEDKFRAFKNLQVKRNLISRKIEQQEKQEQIRTTMLLGYLTCLAERLNCLIKYFANIHSSDNELTIKEFQRDLEFCRYFLGTKIENPIRSTNENPMILVYREFSFGITPIHTIKKMMSHFQTENLDEKKINNLVSQLVEDLSKNEVFLDLIFKKIKEYNGSWILRIMDLIRQNNHPTYELPERAMNRWHSQSLSKDSKGLSLEHSNQFLLALLNRKNFSRLRRTPNPLIQAANIWVEKQF